MSTSSTSSSMPTQKKGTLKARLTQRAHEFVNKTGKTISEQARNIKNVAKDAAYMFGITSKPGSIDFEKPHADEIDKFITESINKEFSSLKKGSIRTRSAKGGKKPTQKRRKHRRKTHNNNNL